MVKLVVVVVIVVVVRLGKTVVVVNDRGVVVEVVYTSQLSQGLERKRGG